MTPTATIHDNVKTKKIVVKVPASQVDFPYSNEVDRTKQMAAARKYLDDARLAGVNIKVKEI